MEVHETREAHGKCELVSKHKFKAGDFLGRGKLYGLPEYSLWCKGMLLLDNVREFHWTRDDRWGLLTVEKHPAVVAREVLVVDLQEGVVKRSLSLPGLLMSSEMDSPGLRIAFGVRDPMDSKRSHLVIVDTTKPNFEPITVYSGPGDLFQFPRFSWSPDCSAIAFEAIHWTDEGTRFSLVHVRLSPEPVVVRASDSSGCGSIDWSDPAHPR